MVRKTIERGRIDVIVRKRPLNELEILKGEKDIVICNYDSGTIREFKCKIDGTNFIEEHEFKVDRFYDEKADNELIYKEYVKPLVECSFREKKTCSCFTYGQTGSGKTYTMIGSRIPKKYIDSESKVVAGIYEYAANDIYRILKEPEFEGKIDVVISFYEIYCGKLYDLLQNRKLLESLDNGKREVIIRDLSVRTVTSKEDLVEHMLEGLNLRKIGQNSQNDHSSRSHALLRIELKNKENGKYQGGIIFIDLAGSERGADSINMCKQIQIDGAGINRSLLALKECIRAMDMDKIHIPFRNSELTKVLRDVFMGGSRNVMIANICPSLQSCEQTLNTLRYASRVKNFKGNSNNGCNSNNSLSSFNTFDCISTDDNNNVNKDSNTHNKNEENSNNSSSNRDNNNNYKNYTRFISLPPTKYNSSKYLQYSKSPISSKYVKDGKRTSPRSSNSSLDSETKNNYDKIDIDVVGVDQYISTLDTEMYSSSPSLILDDLNSSSSSTNTIIRNKDSSNNNNKNNKNINNKDNSTIEIIDRILKSHDKTTLNNINMILDSIKLNEFYSGVYNFMSSGSKYSSINDQQFKNFNCLNKMEIKKEDNSRKDQGEENINSNTINEVLKVYNLYSKVSSMIKMLTASENPIEDINNKFKMELKMLLYLRQVLHNKYN